jgi:hypothetical protein
MRNSQHTARRALLLGLGVSLLASASVPPAYSISITGSKKPSSFDLPCAEKLEGDTASDADQAPSNNPDLAPMSLGETKPKDDATTGATNTASDTPAPEGTLNASVTTNSFVPKGPLEGDNSGLLAPTSVKGSKITKDVSGLGKGSLIETAKAINVAPLALIDSSNDVERKLDEKSEIEREQITGLWEATLSRSPDINFVITKLMPTSNSAKTATILMRLTSTAMMGALGTVGMMYPGGGGYMIQSGGMSIMNQLLNVTEGNAAKKAKITESEQLQLYSLIRRTADNLVASYRTYKDKHKSLLRANADFEDLKSLAPEARKDGAKVLEIEYTLKKQQRDIEEIGSQLGTCRQQLLDMAGGDAVTKLDLAIDEEMKRLHPELANAVPAAAPTGGGAEVKSPEEGAAPSEKLNQEPQSNAPVVADENQNVKEKASSTQVAGKPGNSKEKHHHFKLPL